MYVHYHWYLKTNLKYKHSGATGKLVGVVSINDITVYYGSNSTAMGAVRASSQSRAALLTRPPACLQDKRDEVVLVSVLRRFDRGVGLRSQSRRCATALVDIALGPGAHHADVEDSRIYTYQPVHVYQRVWILQYLTKNRYDILPVVLPVVVCHTTGTLYPYVRTTRVRTFNVLSQLSDWKRAHMCAENHVCFGRIHVSQYVHVYVPYGTRIHTRRSGVYGTSWCVPSDVPPLVREVHTWFFQSES